LGTLLADLDLLAANDRVHGLTIWKVQDGYQVSLQTAKNDGFRVMRRATPSAGIKAVMSMDWMDAGHQEQPKPLPKPVATPAPFPFKAPEKMPWET
jgi:hypothetical protein